MYRNNVWKFVILSRLFFICLSAVSNFIIEDHEPTDTFKTEKFISKSKFDDTIRFLFGGLLRWDAHHFLHIAQHGYTFENNLAFFPLYPLILRLCSSPFKFFLSQLLSEVSILLLCATLLNIFLFASSAVSLYDLTLRLYQNSLFAYKTSLFFCLSPATVFFIAPYSESLFSFFVLHGMLQNLSNRKLISTVLFALSAAVRSNGVLNAGFVMHLLLFNLVGVFKPETKLAFGRLLQSLKIILLIISSFVTVLTPYMMFQLYGYYEYCVSKTMDVPPPLVDYGVKNDLVMPFNSSEWCNEALPLPYFYIQKKYWDVGFLKYYEWRQVPNFILATPITTLILFYGLPYLAVNRHLFLQPRVVYRKLHQKEGQVKDHLTKCVFVHVVHAVALTLYCVLCINVQVTTRMLASSSPLIYWIASGEWTDDSKNHFKGKRKKWKFLWSLIVSTPTSDVGKYVRLFFLTYLILGITFFSNGFPWT